MTFELNHLPYPNNALEPVIDQETMSIHHGKHHNAYTVKLNEALKGTDWENKSIEYILSNLNDLPENIRNVVRNNGGGYYNHSLFWSIMRPSVENNKPVGVLANAIEKELNGFNSFKEAFATKAVGQFGSGWAWLIVTADKKLAITSTPNQDTPIMGTPIVAQSGTPILGLDVWEHAYYLKYQNRRPDYIAAWWNIVNWDEVTAKYSKLI
jgi:superoxide dismutase, Fe-Mn family